MNICIFTYITYFIKIHIIFLCFLPPGNWHLHKYSHIILMNIHINIPLKIEFSLSREFMIQANPSLSATQGKGKISQKQFFNLCTSRQLNVRRLLETLGASKVNNCWVIKFKKIIRVKFIWLSDCLIIWLFFSFIAFDCFSAFRFFFYFLYFLPFLFPYFLISLFFRFFFSASRCP